LKPFNFVFGDDGKLDAINDETKLEIHACLSLLIQHYVPFLYKHSKIYLQCFAQLFRLLLQYHDPVLALHFDKHRIEPDTYVVPWATTLLSNFVKEDEVLKLWDQIFIENDVTFPSFIALSLILQNRDKLLGCKNLDELNQQFKELPMVTPDLNQAHNLKNQTPLSARNQLESLLWPTVQFNVEEVYKELEASVVLPVPTSEIIEAFRKVSLTPKTLHSKPLTTSVRYIIIDCRSLKSFRFARLPTAVHIGQHVGYDAQRMQAILNRFVDAKGSHFSIFGTGRGLPDEDNLLKVIAMRFVANGFEHISTAKGGFAECIKYITNNEIEFVRDVDSNQSQTQTSDFRATEKIAETVSSLWNWGKKVAEDYINEAEKKVAAVAHQREEHSNAPPKSAFTLDSDSDEEIEEERAPKRQAELKVVKIDNLRNMCKVFAAKLENGGHAARFIAVGENMILCLKSHPTMLGHAIILWQRTLRQLVRLAYHRDNPNLLTFVIKGYPNTLSYEPTGLLTAPTFEERYLMEDAKECIKIIQEETSKLKKKKN
jgi:hypothetical protein